MTKREAIKHLEFLKIAFLVNAKPLDVKPEALDLAIKALMVYRDCKHCTHNIKMGNMRGCELWDCDFEDIRGEENDI